MTWREIYDSEEHVSDIDYKTESEILRDLLRLEKKENMLLRNMIELLEKDIEKLKVSCIS